MVSESEFVYESGDLVCDGVRLDEIAKQNGTPAYVYSGQGIRRRFQAYETALHGMVHRICYSVKANSNLGILRLLAKEGAGFDIVSGGELHRVLAAGGDPGTVVFSGVGKTENEIRFALRQGIHSFNCESESELRLISELAVEVDRSASVAIRVNPDVDAVTHPYISTGLREHKFGVDFEQVEQIYLRAATLPGLRVEGVSCHIGSQLLSIEPLVEAAEKTLQLVKRLRSGGLPIRYLDIGGGLGVSYRKEDQSVTAQELIERLRPKLASLDLMLMLEPGRSIVAEAGVLLTRVLLVKGNGAKKFVVVDAAMNDLIRPALYQAYHEIQTVRERQSREETVDVVGPVCETGDFFARGRLLPVVTAGDLLAIRTAGAYGFSLASNYNSRLRPCEILVQDGVARVVRSRESYDDMLRNELSLLPHL